MYIHFVIGVADDSCLAVSVNDIYLVPTRDPNNVNRTINPAPTQYSGIYCPCCFPYLKSDGHWNTFKPHNSLNYRYYPQMARVLCQHAKLT